MNQVPNHAEQLMMAAESYSQLWEACKAEPTAIESALWAREAARLGPQVTLAFVEYWLGGGGQGSYRRVPTIEEFLSRADPHYVSAAGALETLRLEIMRCGPYESPTIKDARLCEAVVQLGGWAKVNSEMPDPSDEFAFKRFTERFRHAWTRSEALAVQGKLAPPPLLGLIAAPHQLKIAEVSAVDHGDALSVGFSPQGG